MCNIIGKGRIKLLGLVSGRINLQLCIIVCAESRRLPAVGYSPVWPQNSTVFVSSFLPLKITLVKEGILIRLKFDSNQVSLL